MVNLTPLPPILLGLTIYNIRASTYKITKMASSISEVIFFLFFSLSHRLFYYFVCPTICLRPCLSLYTFMFVCLYYCLSASLSLSIYLSTLVYWQFFLLAFICTMCPETFVYCEYTIKFKKTPWTYDKYVFL